MRIGLFGGTFNPVHVGHLRAALEVKEGFKLDEVILIPAAMPPHKTPAEVADAADRLHMLALALEEISDLKISDVESISTLASVNGSLSSRFFTCAIFSALTTRPVVLSPLKTLIFPFVFSRVTFVFPSRLILYSETSRFSYLLKAQLNEPNAKKPSTIYNTVVLNFIILPPIRFYPESLQQYHWLNRFALILLSYSKQ